MNHGRHGNPLRGARKDVWGKELCAVDQPSARKSDALPIDCGRMAVVECEAHSRQWPQWLFAILHAASHSIRQDTTLAAEIHVCQREHFPPHSNSGGSYRPSFFLLPSRTCLYFLIFGNAVIEGRSSLHDFLGRYIMEFEKTPEIRSINYMEKVKLRVERGKSG